MATTAYDIIKRPIITEQSMAETEAKKYTFEVAKSANKIEICLLYTSSSPPASRSRSSCNEARRSREQARSESRR